MRYELRRRLVTVARCLAELGETENARAIARRVHDGTAVEWLRGEHGGTIRQCQGCGCLVAAGT